MPAEPRGAEAAVKPAGDSATPGSSQLRAKTAKTTSKTTVAAAKRADPPAAERTPEPEVQGVRYYVEPKVPEAVRTTVTSASPVDASPAGEK